MKKKPIITHINATPKFFKNKKVVKALKKLIKLAYKKELKDGR